MRLFIKELEIRDWKGVKHESFQFENKETTFEGANGTGKTSLFDAVLWCLFGIDHLDRSDHEIRPTKNGLPVHHLNSEVMMRLTVDDLHELSLKRVYKEDWVKPKTKTEEEYKGNTTEYSINEVTVQKKEYDAKVASICSVNGFKAVTNTRYFTSLKRDEQRKILFDMAGLISDEQVANGNLEFEELLKEVTGISFDAFKKTLTAKKKKIQDSIDDNVPRIAELKRNQPEEQNWQELQEKLNAKEKALESIEAGLADVAVKSEEENKKRLDIQDQINKTEQVNHGLKISDENLHNESIENLKQKIRHLEIVKGDRTRDGKTKSVRLDFLKGERARLQVKKDELLKEYHSISAETIVFKEGEFICPTCKRSLEESDIEERQQHMTEEFNRSKTERIEKNIREGKSLKTQIEAYDKEIEEIGEVSLADVSDIENEIVKIKEALSKAEVAPLTYKDSASYKANEKRIADLRTLLQSGNTNPSDTDLKAQKEALKGEIKELNASLSLRDTITNTVARINELEGQTRSLNQAKADLEKKEQTIRNFEDAKSKKVEDAVNKQFSLVRFRLFRTQVDGQVVPDCECMANGVLYSTLNNAMQIAAGLDIIKALNRHYNLYAPVFVDNRESVTEIPDMDCQIINLVVNPQRKKLIQVSQTEGALFS